MKVAIIDYGMGNLRSVQKALEHIGASAYISDDKDEIAKADRAILPGVGAYRDCRAMLLQSGMDKVVLDTIAQRKPIMGICIGMQLLFAGSNEGGQYDGLNVFSGQVERLKTNLKIPHMGWNQIKSIKKNPLLAGVDGGDFYFVHSYAAHDTEKDYVAAITNYGCDFVSAVYCGNVMGTQFHPEKSGELGLTVLRNFLTL